MRQLVRNSLCVVALTMLCAAVGVAVRAQQAERLAAPAADALAAVRFESLDIFIDTAEPLAAWQFELTDANGAMLIVGVENGDSQAFPQAPYFDLDAVRSGLADRIIVADFNTASDATLPSGTTRIATVHVQYDTQRNPDYALRLVAAGNAAGEPIEADIRLAN